MIIRSGWNEETELLDCILMNTVAHETFYVRSIRVNTKHFEIFMIAATKYGRYDYGSQVWNRSENVYRDYKTFIAYIW